MGLTLSYLSAHIRDSVDPQLHACLSGCKAGREELAYVQGKVADEENSGWGTLRFRLPRVELPLLSWHRDEEGAKQENPLWGQKLRDPKEPYVKQESSGRELKDGSQPPA